MMGYTDRHFRFLVRLLAPNTLLYSEMQTTGALLCGPRERLLATAPGENMTALQLGGNKPAELALCAGYGELAGYREINLNVGCPSSRVRSGNFGACLMLQPKLVADCIRAMQAEVSLPVTVKCRTGVDDEDSYAAFRRFVDQVAEGGCQTFIVHARKALQNLSPKANREVPPLTYEYVERLRQERPDLTLVLNGGIRELNQVLSFAQRFDGVMLGRKICRDTWFLVQAEAAVYGCRGARSRLQTARTYLLYVAEELQKGTPIRQMTRHLCGLFYACPGAAEMRRQVSEAPDGEAGLRQLEEALGRAEEAAAVDAADSVL